MERRLVMLLPESLRYRAQRGGPVFAPLGFKSAEFMHTEAVARPATACPNAIATPPRLSPPASCRVSRRRTDEIAGPHMLRSKRTRVGGGRPADPHRVRATSTSTAILGSTAVAAGCCYCCCRCCCRRCCCCCSASAPRSNASSSASSASSNESPESDANGVCVGAAVGLGMDALWLGRDPLALLGCAGAAALAVLGLVRVLCCHTELVEQLLRQVL